MKHLRPSRRSFFVLAFLVACGGMSADIRHAWAETPASPVAIPADEAAAIDAVLLKGKDLEEAFEWGEAIHHYEEASKRFPSNGPIYQRLIISRLHQDVIRRMGDNSFLQSIRRLSKRQALDLYSEVLANLETHYVNTPDWSRVMIFGTASLETALTEEDFVSVLLPNIDSERISQFHANVHSRIQGRSTATRFDLRANVSRVADMASAELGLSPTAVVLEYLSGAMSTLDAYTALLSPDQLREMFSGINGNFVGLGVELRAVDDYLQIVSVIAGGPAEESGLKAGDRIISVDGVTGTIAGTGHIAELLRGTEGSYVELLVEHVDQSREPKRVVRRRVDVPCIENVHFVDPQNNVAYLRLTSFQKSTVVDVDEKLRELSGQRMKALIIDLRGNPGGLLDSAIALADRFISRGRILSTRGRNPNENFDYNAHTAGTWNVPLAVLIDEESASASEVFAGAIGDHGRGDIVGQTSYGKGTVQGIFSMRSADFGLRLTTARYYLPSGRTINELGVTPSVEVEPTYIAARPTENGTIALDEDDSVLQAAVKSLVSGPMMISRK